VATNRDLNKDECCECGYLTDEQCVYCEEPVCEDCIEMHYEYSHPEEA